jgi:hypothetical protein
VIVRGRGTYQLSGISCWLLAISCWLMALEGRGGFLIRCCDICRVGLLRPTMRIKLSAIRVVGRHRASSVPPPPPCPEARMWPVTTTQAAVHCGCGRGPALREPDMGECFLSLMRMGQALCLTALVHCR